MKETGSAEKYSSSVIRIRYAPIKKGRTGRQSFTGKRLLTSKFKMKAVAAELPGLIPANSMDWKLFRKR
jgi:hypothetical protein